MSRIPVFIEKKARKGWSHSNEACIFIACDSTDSSGENDECDIDHLGDKPETSTKDKDDPLKVRLFASDDFDTSGELIYKHGVSKLATEKDKPIDTNNHNDESDIVTSETGFDSEDTKLNASEDTCLSVAVVSCCKGIIQGKCTCSKCGGQAETLAQINNLASSNAPKVMHSLLPVPTKLIPGKVEITPAPVKRSNVKKKNMLNESKSLSQNIVEPEKIISAKSKVDSKTKTDDTFVKKLKKFDLDGDQSESHSIYDYEDSEPESTQHEYQKLLDGIQRLNTNDKVIDFRTKDPKLIPSKQTVLNMVHRSSGIPIVQSTRTTTQTPDSRCISVSPSSSVTPRMTISRSSDRPSSATSNSSISRGFNKSSVSREESPALEIKTPTSNHKTKSSISSFSSSSLSKGHFQTGNRNALNGREKIHDYYSSKTDTQKMKDLESKISSKELKVVRSKEKISSERSIELIKRHLPNAPSQRRIVKYGERCDERNIPGQESVTQKKSSKLKQSNFRSTGNYSVSKETTRKDAQKPSDWDLRDRLQCMEEEIKQMALQNERLSRIESTHSQLSRTMEEKERVAHETNRENEELKKQLRDTEDKVHAVTRQLERDTEDFQFTKATLQSQKLALEGEVTALQQEVSGLKSSVAQLTSSHSGTQAELEATKLAFEQSTRYGQEKDAENVSLRKIIREKEAIIDEANKQLRHHETVRRKLHNTIQELRGNIRVFCRVRPLIGDEVLESEGISHMSFPNDENRTLELEKLGEMGLNGLTMGGLKKSGGGRHQFIFDRVFAPESTQVDVFMEISQLVQSALDGYNVCIFAYGQTGSGKTYTMEGPAQAEEETRGMIPRAVLQIFTCVTELREKGWKYNFEATFLEIYNEAIRDLIGNHGKHVRHEIKLGTNGEDVTVTNISSIPITEERQVLELLQKASQNRSVGETLCNERSSRSHSVFRLKISGNNNITGEACCGTLNLVDLAGSEKLKDSGATGQRLKETQNINKSLSNLGNVIMALANKESHIPYRNSKLTYLLQNSLGGNSKTLMFVNVSPKEENFAETLNSLRFATKVNQCNIGTATRKTK